ncbi:MAG: exonuclease [Cenarchaeum sp. SB0661_bin_35]|nr:exonuclease [Cenarchaeum sp. SB0662_bin_33]MYC79610.1 exonuclease [Cenarchaeum sp. SB0661_bin_35]MYD59078.1 exonuclease [Cenarchaeum sp. SB0678_bin_8]
MTSRGVLCTSGDATILFDPKTASSGINFVSHAHIDHLPSSSGGTILASRYTAELASHRGRDLGCCTEDMQDCTLYDTGHIFGSRGVLFGDTFYTGDICTRDRGFLQGARIPKCKTLITECTFGLPEFVFPSVRQVCLQVDEIISSMYSRGVPVVLMGYELGKAQTLSHLFAHWEPLYYHDSIKAINEMHRRWNVPLKPALGHTEAERQGLLNKKPWVMIAPKMSAKSPFVLKMKKYGAVTISFSGWAKSGRFPYSNGADYSIQLSDHCDFNELIKMVEVSGAENIYTIHGFVSEFSDYLKKCGFNAMPLMTS